MSNIKPTLSSTLFLDQWVYGDDQLAPLTVTVRELDLKSYSDDNNVIVMTLGSLSIHMNRSQLEFIAAAMSDAAAAAAGDTNVTRTLDQTKTTQEVN